MAQIFCSHRRIHATCEQRVLASCLGIFHHGEPLIELRSHLLALLKFGGSDDRGLDFESSEGTFTGGQRRRGCFHGGEGIGYGFALHYRDFFAFVKNRDRPYTGDMPISQAILPVAGLGTRFLPWTKVVPKELLPIGNQPIIALLVDECLSIGITDICFVISHGKELIPQYFYANPGLEEELERRGKRDALMELMKYDNVHFHVIYQEQQLGDGHAILQARDWVKSDTLAILFGDDLIHGQKNGLTQLNTAWQELGSPTDTAMLCLEDVDRAMVSKYGIVEIAADKHKTRTKTILGLVEKPKPEEAPSTLGIVGKYLVPRSTIDTLASVESGHHDQEIRLIDAFKKQLGTIQMYGYEFEGERFDTGTPEGYKRAIETLG